MREDQKQYFVSDRSLLAGVSRSRINTVVICSLVIGLLITALNIWQLSFLQNQHFLIEHATPEGYPGSDGSQRTYVVYAKHPDTGYLDHVFNVLNRAGYVRGNYNRSDHWDVMWAHDYPFKKIREKMLAMKPGQKVNKFPGSGFITNKVNLATSGIQNVPPAFHMPDEKDKLLEYARKFPEKMFVQKSNNHRGIQIQKVSDLDLKIENSFIQEFVHNPLLIDGYKFDVGIYTTLSSVDPLRIYVHHSDALLRFCPEKYHPFDSKNRDKYVVHDDYLPSWKIPSFEKYMNKMGFSFTDTLNTYIRGMGKDPEEMWQKMYSTIAEVYKKHESMFIKAISHYPHKRVFFEMVRFDFVIGEDLNVYLMEANMSPNLSSAHFPPNRLLYEQVVHSVLKLVGVVQGSISWDLLKPTTKEEKDMVVSDKDIVVFPDECTSSDCQGSDSCRLEKCDLCLPCLNEDDKHVFKAAWTENANKHAARRIFPLPVSRQNSSIPADSSLSRANRRMENWFRGKCLLDLNFCN